MKDILQKVGVGKHELVSGTYTGLVGGTIFGAIIGVFFSLIGAQKSILITIAGIVGSSSAVVGFIINLIISVVIAISFVVLFGKHITNNVQGAVFGLSYGLIWWILGPFILMPFLLTGSFGSIQFSNEAASMKIATLWAHLIFGVIIGLMYAHIFAGKREKHINTETE